ncbi:DUF262 domain-containing protein [Agrobacterium pusense]|uniref:DUF262 domain-containing protein n=1 Tax=Agrobacterium pusense TaxID=648995 RepID=UPI001C6E311C|nr:DUF262 domain-containing protein [Agrobacterium pusense]MBW9059177.1 DUF262 domain-containing protein [Agrobacterium pusense]
MTRLTTNSQETTLGDLLSIGTSLYLIPFFQREYRWAPDKANNLLQDILNVVDGLTDKHFLGAVIVHGRRANPTDPKVFEVIDGQQRLTTAFLFISALVKVLAQVKQHDEAAKLAQNYLQIGRDYRKSNLRIHSSRLDRTMMRAVIEDLKSDTDLLASLKPYDLNALPSYGSNRGPLRNNYNRFKRFFADELDQGGIERVRQIYEAFLNNFTVVQIDVLDPTDGPKIFDSLNSKQEPMKISDLVRNEIFRKISDESPEKIERIDEEVWQPFYASFEASGVNSFEKFLFPFGLVSDPNLKKSDVFINLRAQWNALADPSEIIATMERFKAPYLDSLLGRNACGFSTTLALPYMRLAALGAPSSILPFTMQLGRAVLDGIVSELAAAEVLSIVETFLVRRAIAGYEPTGLHAVFKRLWIDVKDNVTSDAVSKAISAHKTVTWPHAEEVKKAIETRPLYGSAITPYLLMEYDTFLGGDTNDAIETIEHVLPQVADAAWQATYGEGFVSGDKDALPNLLPCTGRMNSSLGNQPYHLKRDRFAKDSKFKSTRDFSDKFPVWNWEAFRVRSKAMGEWAVQRWPHEKTTF